MADAFELFLKTVNPFAVEWERFTPTATLIDETPWCETDRSRYVSFHAASRERMRSRTPFEDAYDADEAIRVQHQMVHDRPIVRKHNQYAAVQKRARRAEHIINIKGIPTPGMPSNFEGVGARDVSG